MNNKNNTPTQGDFFAIFDSQPSVDETPLVHSSSKEALPTVTPPEEASAAPVVDMPHESIVPTQNNPAKKSTSTKSAAKDDLDSGAELFYNRRGKSASIKWEDVSHYNPALKVKEIVKTAIWPKPDFEKLVEDGMNPYVAHLFKQAYAAVPAKPVVKSLQDLNDEKFESYIKAVELAKLAITEWISSPSDLRLLESENHRYIGGVRLTSYDDDFTSAGKSLKQRMFGEKERDVEGKFAILGGRAFENAVSFNSYQIGKASKDVEKGWPSKRESWQIQGLQILEHPTVFCGLNEHSRRPGSSLIKIGGRFIKSFDSLDEAEQFKSSIKPFVLLDKAHRYLDSYLTKDEALAGARETTKKEKTSKISVKGINVVMAERTGPSWRQNNRDVTSDELREVFGFKGINFGNWMKTAATRKEAQLHLNHAFDSLHDLCDIMGLTPKAVSMDGMLGLAIGAQGSGGTAAAHFVPGVNEINITRTAGAGFLAHEWGHAFDHNNAVKNGLSTFDPPYLTEHASPSLLTRKGLATNEASPEVVKAFAEIVSAMNLRDQTREEFLTETKQYDDKTKKQLGLWLSSIKADFTKTTYYKEAVPHPVFENIEARIMKGEVGDGFVEAGRGNYFSPIVVEMRDAYKAEHGTTYSIKNSQALQAWINRHLKSFSEREFVVKKVPTNFALEAAELDKGKGGKAYWNTDCEKFARSLHAYVAEKLDQKGLVNTYLAADLGSTLPKGKDREVICKAFDKLFMALNTLHIDRHASAGLTAEVPNPLSRNDLETELQRLRDEWIGMPEYKLVDRAGTSASGSGIAGEFHDGVIYLDRSRITSVETLERALLEQYTRHHSFMEFIEGPMRKVVGQSIRALKEAKCPALHELACEVHAAAENLSPSDEVERMITLAAKKCIEDSSEGIPDSYGFLKNVFSCFEHSLKNLGFKTAFAEHDLLKFISYAPEIKELSQDLELDSPVPTRRISLRQ